MWNAQGAFCISVTMLNFVQYWSMVENGVSANDTDVYG